MKINVFTTIIFCLPILVDKIGGYYNDWVEIYWINTLNASSDYLGLIDIIAVSVYFIYFLWFGHYSDSLKPSKYGRRIPILLISCILTFGSWFTWFIHPNFGNSNNESIKLAIWFGLLNMLNQVFWNSWSVSWYALGYEASSNQNESMNMEDSEKNKLNSQKQYSKDQIRTYFLGSTMIANFIGAAIGAIIPGYLSPTTKDYFLFMLAFAIPFIDNDSSCSH